MTKEKNMAKHVIEYDCKCYSCDGTGLYIGFAEHDGSAIVCRNCKGSGRIHEKIEYEDFEGRKKKKDIKRVYKRNPGIGIGERNGDGKALKLEDFGGMSYKDWLDNKPFPKGHEMRKYTCPCWWYQGEDYNLKPNWEECEIAGTFSDCKNFKTKEECWKRFDKEHPEKKP
jgi:hypothetical protein